ncbi:MAG: SDR family NAD(P)-dependent oxidoreductase [Alphaproteobacteria bacterium]
MYENRYQYVPNVVLITGATGDFGKAFAHRFAALGSKLILFGRNADKLKTLSDSLSTEYSVETYQCAFDIKDKEAMVEAIESIPNEFENIDLLINNAGLALGLEPAQECDLEDWETMIAVNNMALVRMTRLIISGMAERKCGHIINIGSIAGNYPYPGGNIYCATKAFVKQFSLSLRGDLQGTNVRVTNIEPGAIETQFSKVRFKGDEKRADAVYANTNNMNADDVAEAIVWSATLPPYFNVNRMEIMPTVQSFAPNPIERFD